MQDKKAIKVGKMQATHVIIPTDRPNRKRCMKKRCMLDKIIHN